MTFIEIAKPNWIERLLVILVQGIFYNAYFLLYLIAPAVAHRVVGYFEEEAYRSYTNYLALIDAGDHENVAAPDIAIKYWSLDRNASLRDVVLAVRQDEAGHRDVNHGYADELGGGPVNEQLRAKRNSRGADLIAPVSTVRSNDLDVGAAVLRSLQRMLKDCPVDEPERFTDIARSIQFYIDTSPKRESSCRLHRAVPQADAPGTETGARGLERLKSITRLRRRRQKLRVTCAGSSRRSLVSVAVALVFLHWDNRLTRLLVLRGSLLR